MRYLIIIFLLTGCSSFTFEDYREVKERLKRGIQVTDNLSMKHKGRYIYLQQRNSGAKYGYDYKTGHIRIKFKTEF